MLTGASREWLRLHGEWKSGMLPFAGGVLNQPAAWRDAMQLIESTMNRLQSEKK